METCSAGRNTFYKVLIKKMAAVGCLTVPAKIPRDMQKHITGDLYFSYMINRSIYWNLLSCILFRVVIFFKDVAIGIQKGKGNRPIF